MPSHESFARGALWSLLLAGCASPPPAVAPEAPVAAPATTRPPGVRLPTALRPLRYALALDLDSTSERLSGDLGIDLALAESAAVVWLNGAGLEIEEATLVTGRERLPAKVLQFPEDELIGFVPEHPLEAGPARLEITYTATVPDDEIFGTFRQTEGDEQYIFTQFEASAARRAVPCFDEPSFKARWQLSIRVPEGQRAFSNTPVIAETSEGDRRKFSFAETELLPSYLIAWGVGPLEIVDAGTAGEKKTPLRVIVPRGRSEQTAFARANIGPILERLENYFGRPYPYAKLDSITIPTFFGAMENAGLITYGQSILLARPEEESVAFRKTFVRINAHEIAHQWFGNLVTMKWWDDLWLNEAFTDWVAEKIVSEYRPEWNAGVRKVGERERAMRSDALTSAVPVRQPIRSLADVFSNGSIVYAKGKTVIGMFERWIGEEPFRDGIRAYIDRHAEANADIDDFLAALAETSTPEITSAFKTFILQPGVPEVEMELKCARGAKPQLHLSQRRFLSAGQTAKDSQQWSVPVCIRYGRGTKSARQCTLFTEVEADLELKSVGGCPTWLVGNEEGTGYYRVARSPKLVDATLFGPGRTRISTPERVSIIADLAASANAGDYPSGEALARAPRLLRGADPYVASRVVSVVDAVSEHLVPEDLRGRYQGFVRRTFGPRWKALGWASRAGEDPELTRLRPRLLGLLTGAGNDARIRQKALTQARAWMEDTSRLQPDLVQAVLNAAARTNDADLYARYLDEARKTQDVRRRERLIGALPHFTDAALAERTLALLLDESLDIRVVSSVLFGLRSQSATKGQALDFVRTNFDALVERFPVLFRPFLVYAADQQCTPEGAEAVQAFFEPRMSEMSGGARAYETVMDRIRGCIALKTKQQPSVAKFLRSQR